MFEFPYIDPVAFQIGPFAVHWYGIMYLISFIGGYWLLSRRARSTGFIDAQQVGDLVFYLAFGVVLGGRLGYCLFYAPYLFLDFEPVSIDFSRWFEWARWEVPMWGVLKITQGGMSFHGGFLGVLAAALLYCRKSRLNWMDLMDYVAPAVPIGLFCGRVGNFINGELWGRVTDAPWGMVFPDPAAGDEPRHPSMLYEAFLEGVVLFVILWWFSARPRPRMAVSALFLIGYGAFRFLVEFVRQPDEHMGEGGFIAFDWITMGHLLSLPMIVAGVAMLIAAYRKPVYQAVARS